MFFLPQELVRNSSLIMKEYWSVSKEKLVSLEEGLTPHGEDSCAKSVETRKSCKQLIQFVKFVLYVELLLFIGWASYSLWQTYRLQSIEVKVTDIIREPESESLFEEKSMHETSPPTTEYVDLTNIENPMRKNGLMESEDIVRHELGESFGAKMDVVTSDTKSPESEDCEDQPLTSASNDDKDTMPQGNESSSIIGVDAPDSVEKEVDDVLDSNISSESISESSQSKDYVMVWSFPLFWSIHGFSDYENFEQGVLNDEEKSFKTSFPMRT